MRQPPSAFHRENVIPGNPSGLKAREDSVRSNPGRIALALLFFVTSASAPAAHPGHFAEVAGHAHWIGLAAAGAAAVIAGWLAGKLREDDADEEETEEQDA